MKKCQTCNQQKPITEFSKNRARKDGLQTKCKTCCKERSRKYYQVNKEKQKQQIYASRITRLEQNRRFVFEYLSNNPCSVCGETDPRVLEFDHLRDKEDNVTAILSSGSSQEKIMKEIQKCQVLCANCHRRKTAIEQNWYSHRMLPDRFTTS